MRTDQQIFDHIALALLKQGRSSVTSYGIGRYRLYMNADDPIRCAAGHEIPDSLYNPDMEGTMIYNVAEKYPEVLAAMDVTQDQVFGIVYALQSLHDSTLPENTWPERLKALAVTFDLNSDVVDSFV